MAGSKILVLGGTGPAGICLIRELAYRKHDTVVYARNPSKVPEDLASNPLVQVITGDMSDLASLSAAISQSHTVISLLGPNIIGKEMSPTLFADYYKSSVFPLMREHGVRRIFAMGTISIVQPDDHWTFSRPVLVLLVRLIANAAYRNVLNIADVFNREAHDLDWTVFRIGQISGESDERSWRKDRDDGEAFVGWIGERGWSSSQKRGALARWLVDVAESGAKEWVGKMPAVSKNGAGR